VAVDQIEGEIKKRLSRLARTAKIAGFRPGKVPLKMIAQQYGPQVRMEVLNDAVNDTFVDLVQKENLRVAGYPQIEPIPGSTDQTRFEYTATFEVYPDVVIGDLSGIRIERPVAEVTPADIERTIDILRKQRISFAPATRPATKDDRVTVDFTGTIDGVEFPGGQAKDLAITVGEGRMLPEFEAALVGVVAGDNKAFELTFPQNYHGKEVAGKTAVFSMNVKAVSEARLPPVDAEFALAYGVAGGDLDKLHEEIGANLKIELKRRMIARVRDQVMDALRKSTPVPAPQSLVEMDIQRQMQQAASEMKSRGVEPTSEQLRPEMFREAAPPQEHMATRLRAVEKDVILPVKAVFVAILLYYFYSSRWFEDVALPRTIAQQVVERFFLIYLLINIGLSAVLLRARRLSSIVVQRIIFSSNFLDGLFLAALVFMTGGFGSILYWIFPGLIVRNAVSSPRTAPQIILNGSVIILYIAAGVLNIYIPEDEIAGERDLSSNLLRLAVLLLVTACCYGLQVLIEKHRRALHADHPFEDRQKLRSAGDAGHAGRNVAQLGRVRREVGKPNLAATISRKGDFQLAGQCRTR
jgi:trigger factor